MSKTQEPDNTGTNQFEANASTSITGRSVSFSPDQLLHRNYGSLADHSQSLGREYNESELSQSHDNSRTNKDQNDDSLYSRRGTKIPLKLPLGSSTHPGFRKTPRNRASHPITPGSYSASFASEKAPWNVLRHFNDGFSYDDRYSLYEDITSPNYDDGGSISCVIMDDGSMQKRRVSLTSMYPRQNTIVEEDTPLLDGYDLDSDSECVNTTKQHYYTNRFSSYYHSAKCWLQDNVLTYQNKNIIKCALAYFLASLFTYIPYLNEFCGFDKSYNSHLVATISVFFDPAKTYGGIYEAVFFAIIGGIFGMSISLGSMLCAVWFNEHDMNILGHIMSVVFWCGGAMFIVAFSKAKLNKPSFSSACSLANIIIFISITREGGPYIETVELDMVFTITKIIVIAVIINFLVSVLIWPTSANKKLGDEIVKTISSFRLLLKLLTKTFLVDDINYTDKSVQSAIESYRGTFTSLKESLRLAALEVHNGNMQQKLQLYKEVVESLTRLAQHLGGLRSCCGLQWEIIKDKDKVPNHKPGGNDNEEVCDLSILFELIRYVGPHMKSLAFTCKRTLLHIQEQFVEPDKSHTSIAPSFILLKQNLESALELFEKSQTRALTKLYKQKTGKSYFDDRPNEEVFLIYFFVFNLQEFTRELCCLVDLTDNISRIDANEQKRREGRKWWQFWRWFDWVTRDAEKEQTKNKFPENTNNLFDTIQTPKPKTLPQKIAIKLWKSFSWFRQFEVKYAIKAAVSAAILASPAFIDATRDKYIQFRGEWVLITMMVVMVPTVGGTNLMAVYRLLGTILGCALALIIYTLFSNNPVILSLFGFVIALVCFHLMLYTKYNRIGRFGLLTYNLVALYKYNLRNSTDTMPIADIAFYRSIAVCTGIIWGLVVTSYWWPYEARAELRKGLSQLFVNMGWLYKKLVSIYSVESEVQEPSNSNHTPVMIKTRISISTKEFMDMELLLQISLLKLRGLLEQTPNEPRLKGPFPVSTYRQILIGCQNILDKLLSMRIAVTKEEWYSVIRRDFISPIAEERRELVGNVLLYFYVLAAALRLKTPLPAYLPPAERARKQLLTKIRDLPVVRQRVIEGNDEHYIVYYAYVLVMEDVIRELENLGGIMQELYGCMGGDEFNTFFSDENEGTSGEHNDNGDGAGVGNSVENLASLDEQRNSKTADNSN
ncbi:Fusaric acid resistance protein-like-domain-containing protein [Gigaspora margarita]|uniref:Fusaric acid resistance protein-like-domain-containing protein n=1 Tax=Gigaspora margarita TaxID=4874 RepID=A0A8H3X0X9_GIGMA|nr:Fusaric acid resistance protein-like-domain-containing protein [Gigaspora margarita]